MKVSVIVPVYGVEAWIARCAHSLLSQTWEDLEIIFVNDGTPDKSMEILAEVLKLYPKREVIILHKENAGPPQARLSGLKKATGDYVLYMDSDDWAQPEMIEKLARAAMATGADMVYCNAVEDRPKGRVRRIHNRRYSDCMSYARAMVDFRVNSYLWNKLIRRSLYREDLFYPTIGMHDDMVLLSQVLPLGCQCTLVDEVLYHYNRTNVHSLSLQKKEERDIASARNYLQLCSFWKGRTDSPVASLLPSLILRAGWIALRYAPSLADEYPILRDYLLQLHLSAFSNPKKIYRFLRIKAGLL
ncbi:MAG: glycosyltransferase family 2 protein [Bacteroidales bacterium]|nr:glycosyltransferase family 2 protein [Bacteroidales bacterium]